MKIAIITGASAGLGLEFLKALPATERCIFLRRYWYMDSIPTIAEHYGFSRSKVTSMLHRTRGKLRTVLEQEGYI